MRNYVKRKRSGGLHNSPLSDDGAVGYRQRSPCTRLSSGTVNRERSASGSRFSGAATKREGYVRNGVENMARSGLGASPGARAQPSAEGLAPEGMSSFSIYQVVIGSFFIKCAY